MKKHQIRAADIEKEMQEQSLFKERNMNLKERTDSNNRIQWKRSNGMNLSNQRKE